MSYWSAPRGSGSPTAYFGSTEWQRLGQAPAGDAGDMSETASAAPGRVRSVRGANAEWQGAFMLKASVRSTPFPGTEKELLTQKKYQL